MVARWEGPGGLGETGNGIEKYKLAAIKQSQGCKVQHGKFCQ